ncbi:MAG: FAD:protein FMN transferase, partial [Pseudomonadota bacterium]
MTRSTFSRRRFIGVLAAASTLGTARAESWTQHTWRGRALGADARLTLSGPPAQVDAALRDAIAALREVEALFSLHDPSSALARLNATGRLDPAPEALLALLHRCTTLHAVTEGRFDPTVQPLWRALYEGGDAARLARAHAAIGWHRVRLSDRAVQLDA